MRLTTITSACFSIQSNRIRIGEWVQHEIHGKRLYEFECECVVSCSRYYNYNVPALRVQSHVRRSTSVQFIQLDIFSVLLFVHKYIENAERNEQSCERRWWHRVCVVCVCVDVDIKRLHSIMLFLRIFRFVYLRGASPSHSLCGSSPYYFPADEPHALHWRGKNCAANDSSPNVRRSPSCPFVENNFPSVHCNDIFIWKKKKIHFRIIY